MISKDTFRKKLRDGLLDEKEITWESGQHSLNLMKEASIAVKSPGIPRDIPLLEHLRGNGTRIFSEIEFAAQEINFESITNPKAISLA